MSFDTAKAVKERIRRWEDMHNRDLPPRHLIYVNYRSDNENVTPAYPELKQERIEWAWKLYQRKLERLEWLDDDSIPYLWPRTGTEVFAEAFGCKVHRPPGSNPCALPMVQSASEAEKLKTPDLSAPCIALVFEIADELKKRGGKDAVMKISDMQSPMDIVALIWDKTDLFVAMLETPEVVKELAAKVCQLMILFADEWFKRYGVNFISHAPNYYMPKGLTLSVDEIGSVSADMFNEFFMPELTELSSRYGGFGMHCCANSRHQWDNIKKIPGLMALNLARPPRVLAEAFRFFADDCIQMHSGSGEGDLEKRASLFPKGSRVVIQCRPGNKADAIDAVTKIRKGMETAGVIRSK